MDRADTARKPRDQRGMTLLEISIAVSIFAILAISAYSMLKSSADTYATGSLYTYMNTQTRNFIDQISKELANAGINTLSPPFPDNSSSLTFQMASGYANGKVVFAAPITYAFQYAPGEINNGIDDNKDGRIDEGVVVRTENGQSVTLSLDLAENGLSFTRISNTVRIAITLEKIDERGTRVLYTRDTTIQIRN